MSFEVLLLSFVIGFVNDIFLKSSEVNNMILVEKCIPSLLINRFI
jgi:hypothetical protein